MAQEQQTLMGSWDGRSVGTNEFGQIVGPASVPVLSAKTAAYTVTHKESGTIFTTTGATTAIAFTLPAIGDGPWQFWFFAGADVEISVVAETADTLVTFNNLAADSVQFTTASMHIGGGFWCFCDGTTAWAIPQSAGGHVQTLTVTDA